MKTVEMNCQLIEIKKLELERQRQLNYSKDTRKIEYVLDD